MAKSNPMSVEFYSAKLEFQGRGAAHNHGTIWLNMDKIEFMVENNEKVERKDLTQYNISNLESCFKESEHVEKEALKSAIKICMNNVHPKTYDETKHEEEAGDVIIRFGHEKLHDISCSVDQILSKFIFLD